MYLCTGVLPVLVLLELAQISKDNGMQLKVVLVLADSVSTLSPLCFALVILLK